jgi:hypothetical protein
MRFPSEKCSFTRIKKIERNHTVDIVRINFLAVILKSGKRAFSGKPRGLQIINSTDTLHHYMHIQAGIEKKINHFTASAIISSQLFL